MISVSHRHRFHIGSGGTDGGGADGSRGGNVQVDIVPLWHVFLQHVCNGQEGLPLINQHAEVPYSSMFNTGRKSSSNNMYHVANMTFWL